MIFRCPKLSRRCRKEDGPKIAHVPVVELDEDYWSLLGKDDDISVKVPEDDEEVRANLSSCTIMGLTFFFFFWMKYGSIMGLT